MDTIEMGKVGHPARKLLCQYHFLDLRVELRGDECDMDRICKAMESCHHLSASLHSTFLTKKGLIQ